MSLFNVSRRLVYVFLFLAHLQLMLILLIFFIIEQWIGWQKVGNKLVMKEGKFLLKLLLALLTYLKLESRIMCVINYECTALTN